MPISTRRGASRATPRVAQEPEEQEEEEEDELEEEQEEEAPPPPPPTSRKRCAPSPLRSPEPAKRPPTAPQPQVQTPSKLISSGIVPSTPDSADPQRQLPASHFTPTERRVLEYMEEEEADEVEGMEVDLPFTRGREVVDLEDSDEEEVVEPVKKMKQPKLMETGYLSRGEGSQAKGRVKANDSPAPAPAKGKGKDSRLSLRNRLAGFASQAGEVDLTGVESDEGEEAEATRPIDVDASPEPAVEEEVVDVDEIPEPMEVDSENVISTAAIPDVQQPTLGNMEDDAQDEIQYIAEQPTQAPDTGERHFRDEIASRASRREITIKCDVDLIRKRLKRDSEAKRAREARREEQKTADEARELIGPDEAGVGNLNSTQVDRVLSRVIAKEDFAQMEIVGQYNSAFIVARRRVEGEEADDLFIIGGFCSTGEGLKLIERVDQHASDEKYNFETLQATTKIKSQSLLQ